MGLSETDRIFIAQHNFDVEDDRFLPPSDWTIRRMQDERLLVEGFVEGNPGRKFSLAEVSRSTGVCDHRCQAILKSTSHVRLKRKYHTWAQYRSVAPPLKPLSPDTPARDTLGKQAREDWWYLVNQRRLQIRKRKVIRRF